MNKRLKLLSAICACTLIIGGCSKIGNKDKATKDYSKDKKEISVCIDGYDEDIDKIKNTDYKVLSFENTDFKDFSGFDSVGIYQFAEEDLSADDSIAIITSWLASIGQEDIDLNTELHDASGQYPIDESKEYPNDYVRVYDKYPNFDKGSGFFINTKTCYIQMMPFGIYSMSDGSIAKASGTNSLAAMDALGLYAEEAVAEGSVEDMKDVSYELVEGEYTVAECAEMTKTYFEKGTPNPCFEGVNVDIPWVRVFKLGDKYGYEFSVRRVFNGVPFAWCQSVSFYPHGDYIVTEEMKNAYVIGNNTVAAYTGHNEAQKIESVSENQTQIINVLNATLILDDFLAENMEVDINTVEYVYCEVSYDDTKQIYPCWQFSGKVTNNDEYMVYYVNSLDGNVYYYSYN